MTDDIRGEVVEPAADCARDRGGRRWMAIAAAAAVLSFLALAALLYAWGSGLQQQVTVLATNAGQQHDAAQTLAEQVRKLGGTPVVSLPPGPAGVPGATGAAGPAGRGITGTAISAGRLFLTYSDGNTEDKGQVVGAAGAKGDAGRGITGANASSGHLVLSYSDGSTSDAGQVVGKDGSNGATGRGVQSVDNRDGHLLVTYTDGTTQDAGPLPAGPPGPTGPTGVPGPKGDPGSPPAGWTWTDTKGTTYQCQRDPKSPNDSPTYSCTAVPKSSSSSPPTLPIPTR